MRSPLHRRRLLQYASGRLSASPSSLPQAALRWSLPAGRLQHCGSASLSPVVCVGGQVATGYLARKKLEDVVTPEAANDILYVGNQSMAAFESYMWTKFSHLDSRLYEMVSTRQSTWSTRARWIWSPRLTRHVKTSYSIISRNTSLATSVFPA